MGYPGTIAGSLSVRHARRIVKGRIVTKCNVASLGLLSRLGVYRYKVAVVKDT